MKKPLLLLEDVENVGRSGDVVTVRPGYARNFLVPQKFAVVANKQTLRIQAKLQEERAKRAAVDLKESSEVKERLEGRHFSIVVKVDPDGHMYGSVSVGDLIDLVAQEGFVLEKRNIALLHAIKTLGKHEVPVKLKEGVKTFFTVTVESDIPLPTKEVVQEVLPPLPADEQQ